jgi:7,8-dihydroneopterin aldolase/epimerase/oxygenase
MKNEFKENPELTYRNKPLAAFDQWIIFVVTKKWIMGLIEIEGMEFYAYHGHFKEEQVVGNKFLVNISIEADCQKAAESDNLADALDYQKVYLLIKSEMEENSCLLEHICNRILERLYREFTVIEKATVKVSKLNPPMGGQIEKVSISMSRTKKEYLPNQSHLSSNGS